jgi:glycosyltransferase involved in cell wall biosynthesis
LTDPAVSAAIVVRDGERFLGAAIESVLGQTVPCLELIVVDNGSTDASRDIAERYAADGVRLLDEPEPGTAPARNLARESFRGEYLGFLDADDLWEAHKNEVQLAAFDGEPRPDVVFGHVVQFAQDSGDAGASPPQPGLLTSSLAPRSSWERVGPWPPGVGNTAEGLDWLLRVRRAGLRELMLPDVVMRRRIHGENVGFRERAGRVELARVVKRELDRRRAEAP